jgi:outer membrane protein
MNAIFRVQRYLWTAIFWLGMWTSLTTNGIAQEPQTLSLDQLIRMALEHSPELGEAEQDIASAESDLAQARAAQWAQLDATAFGGAVDDAKRPVVKISGKQIRRGRSIVATIEEGREDDDESDVGPFGRLELMIVQPIYTFGKIAYRKKAALHGVEVQKAALEMRRGEVIQRVKELYFSLVLAQQGKQAAQETDSFIEDARKRIKRLLDLSSTSVDQSDLYRLEAYAGETEGFKAKADAGQRLAYVALKRMIGLPPEKEFQLDVKELPMDTRALSDQQDYIRRALQNRPEFEQLENGIEAKAHLVEAAKADMYPSIFAAAIGTAAGAPGREHLDEPYIGDDYNKAGMGVVLGAQWHFDLGIGRAKVNKAQAEYQRLLHTKDVAERDIPLQVAKYYQEARENLSSFQAYEKAAAAARKWIVAAFANFDMGVGPAKDIFDAVDRYGKNQGEFLSSLYKYHIALTNLSYAIAEYREGSK